MPGTTSRIPQLRKTLPRAVCIDSKCSAGTIGPGVTAVVNVPVGKGSPALHASDARRTGIKKGKGSPIHSGGHMAVVKPIIKVHHVLVIGVVVVDETAFHQVFMDSND